jgi:hypothetical protein
MYLYVLLMASPRSQHHKPTLLSLSGPICLDPVHADRVSAVPETVLVQSCDQSDRNPRPGFDSIHTEHDRLKCGCAC